MFEKSPPTEAPDLELDPTMDLGSQLEDLFVHTILCERWADLDDRIDLSLRVRRPRQAP